MAREQMIPIILNKNFEKLAEPDDYISFIWTGRFYEVGDFELCLDIRYSEYIVTGYYVMRLNDDHVGIIEKVQYKRTEEAQEMIIVSGRKLPAILARRVIASQTQISGLVTAGIGLLIDENAINPAILARRIPNLTFTNNSQNTIEIDAQYTGDNLLDTASSLCKTYSVGFDAVLRDGIIDFSLYDGVDRSYGQTENPYVIFSENYDNLLTCEFESDFKNYASDVLVGGEGEGISRTFVWSAKSSQSGIERYEKFLDASSAVSNDNIITQETYEKQLEELGIEEITEYSEAFTGEVDFTSANYGTDLWLGDIVTIENTRWGMRVNARLLQVIESVGEDGTYTIVPTFGT